MYCSRPASIPPRIVPIRMARKVPPSTIALPPINSSDFRCWGSMLYLIGPKNVDCVPIKNSTINNTTMEFRKRPRTPIIMMPISIALIFLISALFSFLSAICPASGENRKNGRIKITAARLTRVLLCSETIL